MAEHKSSELPKLRTC